MRERELREILRKYRSGQASPEERKIIDAWYDASQLQEAAHERELSDELGKSYLQNINDRINKLVGVERTSNSSRQINFVSLTIGIAASLILTIGVFLYIFNPSRFDEQAAVRTQHDGWEVKTNTQQTAQALKLPDGSNVILKPNSTVRYLSRFKNSIREVYLEGEGFFEVVHNQKQPFFVYAKHVTAKVLGTSFTVRAFKHDKEVVVAVKTGRVSVDTDSTDGNPARSEVILTPNTEIIYNQDSRRLTKRIVETPLSLLPPEEIKRMRFVDAPVKEVFEAIEKIYGVDLVFDEETFASCVLTTSVSDGGIYKRLDIINDAIGVNYTVIEDKIVITGRGCH